MSTVCVYIIWNNFVVYDDVLESNVHLFFVSFLFCRNMYTIDSSSGVLILNFYCIS